MARVIFSPHAFHFKGLAYMCVTRFSLSMSCPPSSNVLFNPTIPDSLSYARVLPWAEEGLFQLHQFVHPVTCKLCSFSDLQVKYHIPKHMGFFFSISKLNIILPHFPLHFYCLNSSALKVPISYI